jgi:hypothetical protein
MKCRCFNHVLALAAALLLVAPVARAQEVVAAVAAA